jgi:hypothetical protein
MGTLGRKFITESGGMIYRTRDDHKSRCKQSSFTLWIKVGNIFWQKRIY